MKTTFRLVAGLTLASLGLVACGKPAPHGMQPVPVIAAEVLVRDQPIYSEFIGKTFGARDVEVRARVEGFLEAVHFTEGKPVKQGELLYTIDDRLFKAALLQAQGAMAQAQAQWEKACRDTNRLGPLWLANAISRQQYDDSIAVERSAAAYLLTARGALESAQIQLGYTKIYSPLNGLAGKTEVGAGNLVGRGNSTLLTTVSEIDSVLVQFSVSEQMYLEWRRHHGNAEQNREAAQNIFELILADGSLHPHRGSVSFIDRQVDERTGTILLQASFPNPEKVVRPGQFARVRFPIDTITNAVLVPQRSVTELQATYSVFVVRPDNTVEFRKVTPGPRVDNLYVISSGLAAGEKVVVEGVQKLQNNSSVTASFTNLVAAPLTSSK